MDPKTHRRFLDYRERHTYFGKEGSKKVLTMEEFAARDAEWDELHTKGEGKRDDEEEARYIALSIELFRD